MECQEHAQIYREWNVNSDFYTVENFNLIDLYDTMEWYMDYNNY